MNIVAVFVFTFYAYFLIGAAFAVWFLVVGVNRLDENMQESPRSVRFLLFPGSVLLWPVLLKKCINSSKSNTPTS
jgi:bacteriorhodopsin